MIRLQLLENPTFFVPLRMSPDLATECCYILRGEMRRKFGLGRWGEIWLRMKEGLREKQADTAVASDWTRWSVFWGIERPENHVESGSGVRGTGEGGEVEDQRAIWNSFCHQLCGAALTKFRRLLFCAWKYCAIPEVSWSPLFPGKRNFTRHSRRFAGEGTVISEDHLFSVRIGSSNSKRANCLLESRMRKLALDEEMFLP